MTDAQIAQVEALVNAEILANAQAQSRVLPIDEAQKLGAMMLFGEKYGDEVRVLDIGTSRELCGGTHVGSTGEIGLIKIVYEGSISAGVRRVEAVTGAAALKKFQETAGVVHGATSLLRTSEGELLEQIERLITQQKSLERQIEQLKEKAAQAASGDLESQARLIQGVKVLSARVDGMERAQMRSLADSLRNKWQTAVIVLASATDGNVSIISAVTKDLTAKVHAGKLAGAVAQAVGGKGGGRPDLAEAGGKDASALPAALDAVYASVEGML